MAQSFVPKQIAVAASAAASPTSIQPFLPVPSAAGNPLLLVVVATGTPTITAPAGWQVVQNNVAPAGLAVAVFFLPGTLNTGLSNQSVTITATLGGAVAVLMEWPVPSMAVDASATQNATAASYGNLAIPGTAQLNEILFYCAGFAAATLTPSNGADWNPATGTGVSTNGTPNAQVACFISVVTSAQAAAIGGSLSASVVNQEVAVRFFAPGVDTLTRGAQGNFVGQSLNPAGSLQTPQPIAAGNFYSGTVGSF